MQSSTFPGGNLYISLGERRGRSDLAPSLDLTWARAASDCGYSRAYPSPPMSGSPPLPPRSNPESGNRDLGSYAPTAQELVPSQPALQQEYHDRGMGPPMQTFQERPQTSYAAYRPDDMTQQFGFQQPQQHVQHQHHSSLQHPVQHMYASHGQVPFSPERPRTEPQVMSSPSKAQRKTKGHVASACVPCKRAHLRCDAQRPCSRCMTNGKEDACVDVQHKKRGRPRLRDEREPRYEILGPNYPPPPDSMARRPLLSYGDTPYVRVGEHQVSGGYRVLKSQSGISPISPRHMEHATSPIDAHIYGGQMPPTPRMFAPPEPICAYLNMEMQIAKASSGFSETIGVQSVLSRKLHDIVSASDREKISRLSELLEEEKREREPNYLPPIYLKIEEDRLIQSVSFGPEEMAQFRLDRQERITFQGPDGQQRAFQARIGLSKKETTYFIVLLLDLPTTPQTYMPQSTYSSDPQYGFIPPQQASNPAQAPYMSNPPFPDQRVEMTTYRTPGPLAPNMPASMSIPTYSQTPMRQDYTQSQSHYQSPRSEVPPPQPPTQARQQGQGHDLQLPPIRGPPPADPSQRRESGRVDIGGLLEKRDHAGRGH